MRRQDTVVLLYRAGELQSPVSSGPESPVSDRYEGGFQSGKLGQPAVELLQSMLGLWRKNLERNLGLTARVKLSEFHGCRIIASEREQFTGRSARKSLGRPEAAETS